MTNREIADHFSLLSKLMDIHGENAFRSKSYSIAAYHIEQLPQQAAEMNDARLFSAKGIGESTGKKIREILETGKLQQLEDLLAKTPAGVLEMLSIKGLGPKKIAVIWKEMEIETLGELEYACNENRLTAWKGFGSKTQNSLLESIRFYKQQQGLHLWAELYKPATDIHQLLTTTFPLHKTSLTGGLRRQDDIVSHMEFLTTVPEEELSSFFQKTPEAKIETDHPGKIAVHLPDYPPLVFYLTDPEAFHRQLFLSTGPESFIQAFTTAYTIPDTPGSEETIFDIHSLPAIPPPMRNIPDILEALPGTEINLITLQDIKGIIHCHSDWSDGADTLERMALRAKELGYSYLVISDHSQAAYYAKGLKPERIYEQHKQIAELNERLHPFRIFKSIEADILNDGTLDYTPDILSSFDLVIASVHSNLSMTEEKAMSRLLKAIENPFTTILGHPTGRLLLSRNGYLVDFKRLIDACAANQVVLEINAHPRRLDLDWKWIRYAMEKQVLLSIDPDAHSVEGISDVFYGVIAAQKAGLSPSHNLSSFTLEEFEYFLSRQQKKRN